MKIDRLCIVLAHGGAVETVKRHLPIWEQIHDQVIICSPVDDPCILPNKWGFINGRSSRYATDTNLRTREAMRLASVLRPGTLTFCEYDALLWRRPESALARMQPDGVIGSVFQSADRAFQGKFYIHSPIIFGPLAIEKVLAAMDNLPDDAERGFGDRYFGLAIEKAGIPVVDGHMTGLSYSQNHIERQHLDDLINSVKMGIAFTHGIKDAPTLAQVLKRAGLSYG